VVVVLEGVFRNINVSLRPFNSSNFSNSSILLCVAKRETPELKKLNIDIYYLRIPYRTGEIILFFEVFRHIQNCA
jgi:hypothetical protein